jgi:hypothetical protein
MTHLIGKSKQFGGSSRPINFGVVDEGLHHVFLSGDYVSIARDQLAGNQIALGAKRT